MTRTLIILPLRLYLSRCSRARAASPRRSNVTNAQPRNGSNCNSTFTSHVFVHNGQLNRQHPVVALLNQTDQQVWFPVDFPETFSRKLSSICSFNDIYRAGSLTPGITLILFTQAIAQLKDIYWGLIAPISINPGLLQDVLYWYTVKYKNFESARKFPVDFQDFQEC